MIGSGVREVPGKCGFGEGEQGSVAKIRQDKELAPLSVPLSWSEDGAGAWTPWVQWG